MAKFVQLQNGVQMPMICLGTWKSDPGETGAAVKAAIEAGYRGLDCANDYGNEAEIGKALKEIFAAGTVKREDLFIQGKLWNTNHRKEHVRLDLEATLKDLQLPYLDSYLLHWAQACPATGKLALNVNGNRLAPQEEGTMFPVDEKGLYVYDRDSHFMETWHAMEELVDAGLCKTIGLSNFNIEQIREVLMNAKKHKPAILQNECHPYLQLKDMLDFCNIHQIQLQAYMPLGSADRPMAQPEDPEVLQDKQIHKIASKYKKSPAQVVLRWHIQRGVAATPKSVNPGRIKENNDIWDFELTPEDMREFDRFNMHFRMLLNPEACGHPDYPFHDDLPYQYKIGPPPPPTKPKPKSTTQSSK